MKSPVQSPMIRSCLLAVTLALVLFSLAPGQLKSLPPNPPQGGKGQSDPETTRLINSVEGPALFREYCAVCDGSDGRGQGPMAASLKFPPSDLTRIAARNGGVYPQVRIERIISGEEQVPGGHGTRAMPIWGPIFSQIAWDQDLGRVRVRNLATHIGRLQQR